MRIINLDAAGYNPAIIFILIPDCRDRVHHRQIKYVLVFIFPVDPENTFI